MHRSPPYCSHSHAVSGSAVVSSGLASGSTEAPWEAGWPWACSWAVGAGRWVVEVERRKEGDSEVGSFTQHLLKELLFERGPWG